MARIAVVLAALAGALLVPPAALGAATISGTVTQAGNPSVKVAGACVQASTGVGDAEATAVTDAGGAYTLTGLQAGTRTVRFFACGTPYEPTSESNTISGLVDGENRSLHTQFTLLSRSIAGTVTDQDDAPVGGLDVTSFREPTSSFQETVETAFNGRYTLPVGAAGSYKLRIDEINDVYAEEWWQDKATRAAATEIPVSGNVTAINPKVQYDKAQIKGTVTGSTGQPLQNVLVAADGPQDRIVYTNAAGQYEMTVNAGAYTVSFNPQHATATPPTSDHLREYWNDQAASQNANPITVAGGATFTANAQLARGASVAGRLVDDQGNAVPGFEVDVYRADDNAEPDSPFQAQDAVTDANGNFVVRGILLGSTLDRLYVTARAPLGQGQTTYLIPGRSAEFTLAPGQDVTGKNVVAARGGKFRLDVARAGGADLGQLFEVLTLTPQGVMVDRTTSFSAPRDFTSRLLPVGTYRVRAQTLSLAAFGVGYHAGATTLAGSAPVTVTAGTTTQLPDLELPAVTATPANDAVAGAADLGGGSVVAAAAPNLGATRESGEPNVLGHTSSVWWKWTAPASGDFAVDECGPLASDVRVYTGATPATLAAVPGQVSDGGCAGDNRRFAAVAGTTYRIGVTATDATDDARLTIAPYAAGVPETSIALVDPTAPLMGLATDAHRRPGVPTSAARLVFTAINRANGSAYGDGTRTYECALDGAAFGACATPLNLSGLATGSHVMRARATRDGLTDPTPAELRFWVAEPRPECADAVDADGDGANGWPNDTGCISDQDSDERGIGAPIVTAPDGDGDGVPDDTDGCPAVAGPVANQGCPVSDPPPANGGGGGTGGGGSGGAGGAGAGPGGGAAPAVVVPPPARSSSPADRSVAGARLVAAASQRQRKGIAIALTAGAGEPVTVTTVATVKVGRKAYGLKVLRTAIAGGRTAALKLTLAKRSDVARVRRALRRRQKVTAAVTVTFRDAAGNTTVARRTIRLR